MFTSCNDCVKCLVLQQTRVALITGKVEKFETELLRKSVIYRFLTLKVKNLLYKGIAYRK